ncbi:MAG: S49 family peptidase, partial [Myxococcota bacterium]
MLRAPFVFLGNLLGLLAWARSMVFAAIAKRLRRGRPLYVTLKLDGAMPLGMSETGWRRYVQRDITSFMTLREQLQRAATDADVTGLIIELESVQLGTARTSDLIDAIRRVRDAGKHVVMHTKNVTMRELRLLSAAEDALLTPAGRLYTFGLRLEQVFGAEALEKLGAKGQFIHIGAFKTASHQYHKREMTEPQELMMRELHQGLTELFSAQIADGRGITPGQVLDALSEAPMDARAAVRRGLLSGQAFEPEVQRWIAMEKGLLPEPSAEAFEHDPEGDEASGRKKKRGALATMPLARYVAAAPAPYRWEPLLRRRPKLVVVDLTGVIMIDGAGGGLPGSRGPQVRPGDVVPALRTLRRDPRVTGVLLHINSPGGSALASDLMWREIVKLREAKPVVCYMSDVAASGGYYLSVGGDHIVCRPDTITGSIGVVAGTFSIGEGLKRLGVHTSAVTEDEGSAFLSVFEELSPQTMRRLREDARSFYRRFLERVGQAREIERERLHRYARGRVYLGQDALHRGLVDELGGFEVAVDRLCALTDVSKDDAQLEFMEHKSQSLRDLFSASLVRMRQSAPERLLEQWLEEPALALRLLEQERLLAMMPWR